jgi:hypothetical protein
MYFEKAQRDNTNSNNFSAVKMADTNWTTVALYPGTIWDLIRRDSYRYSIDMKSPQVYRSLFFLYILLFIWLLSSLLHLINLALVVIYIYIYYFIYYIIYSVTPLTSHIAGIDIVNGISLQWLAIASSSYNRLMGRTATHPLPSPSHMTYFLWHPAHSSLKATTFIEKSYNRRWLLSLPNYKICM